MGSILKWLEDNPLGIALSALCGLLLLALLVLTLLASLPAQTTAATPAPEGEAEGLQLPVLAQNLPVASYAIITERPLFNENRQPAPHDGDSNGESVPLDEPSGAPEVELSGVIITPTLRMVTLKRTNDAISLVAFEGKPIEADFGSWQVSRIQARAVTLTSGSGEELQLELKVHDAKIEEPIQPVRANRKEAQAGGQSPAVAENSEAEPLSRAEEIRQRIAERREELRRDAEVEGQAGAQSNDQSADQDGDKANQENYQQAIQGLMGRNRGKKSNNDDKQ